MLAMNIAAMKKAEWSLQYTNIAEPFVIKSTGRARKIALYKLHIASTEPRALT